MIGQRIAAELAWKGRTAALARACWSRDDRQLALRKVDAHVLEHVPPFLGVRVPQRRARQAQRLRRSALFERGVRSDLGLGEEGLHARD